MRTLDRLQEPLPTVLQDSQRSCFAALSEAEARNRHPLRNMAIGRERCTLWLGSDHSSAEGVRHQQDHRTGAAGNLAGRRRAAKHAGLLLSDPFAVASAHMVQIERYVDAAIRRTTRNRGEASG